MLKTSCQTDDALTPPARLTAAGKRLQVMLQAISTVRTALDDFYGELTDEQKRSSRRRPGPCGPVPPVGCQRPTHSPPAPSRRLRTESSGISWPSGW